MEDIEQPVGSIDGHARYGSDHVADVLGALGFPYLPLTPGASFRGLHDSIVNHRGNRAPQILLCLHEATAVGVAHSYAKATGRVTPVALHNLVGLMNAQMAVFNAWVDRAPVMMLGGGGPRDPASRRWVDWLHSAPVQGDIVREFVVHDEEPVSHADMLDALARCHSRAGSEPMGPTYLTLDMALQEADVHSGPELDRLSALARPRPVPVADHECVEQAASALRAAELPLVIAGRTGYDAATTRPVTALLEVLGAAGIDERSFVTLPTDHPLNLTIDPGIVAEADVVVLLDPNDPRVALRGVSENATVITVGVGELVHRRWANTGRAQPRGNIELIGDPIATLHRLLEMLRSRPPSPADVATRARRLSERHDAAHASQSARKPPPLGGPLTTRSLVEQVYAAVQHQPWYLAARNGRSWPEGRWKFAGAGRFLGHSGGGGLGYGPAAAVGGALAARERDQLAIAIVGDGDLSMAPSALWTAARYRLPLLVVVNNNQSFMNDEEHQFRVAQQRGRPEANRRIGTGIDDPSVDFGAVARGFGMWAPEQPATTGAEFADQLDRAVAHIAGGEGPCLVDAVTLPSN